MQILTYTNTYTIQRLGESKLSKMQDQGLLNRNLIFTNPNPDTNTNTNTIQRLGESKVSAMTESKDFQIRT